LIKNGFGATFFDRFFSASCHPGRSSRNKNAFLGRPCKEKDLQVNLETLISSTDVMILKILSPKHW
jgi:hypothetical protein